MKRRIGNLITVGILSLLVLTGCGTENVAKGTTASAAQDPKEEAAANETDGKNEAKLIRIGYQPTSSYHIQGLDNEHQWFEKEFSDDGIEIEWIPFNYGPPIIEALTAGELEFTYGIGDTPTINGIVNNAPVVAVSAGPIDTKSYGIVVSGKLRDEVKSLSDLKGRTIALKAGSATENRVLRALAQEGVTRDDLEIVNISATNDLLTALLNNEVDAIGTTEPNITAFTIREDLFSLDISRYAPYAPGSLTLVNTDFARENPELVARFVKTELEVQNYVLSNPQEVKEVIAANTSYEVEELTSVDRWAFLELFDDNTEQALLQTIDSLKDSGDLTTELDVKQIYTNEYLEEAHRLLGE